MYILPSYVIYQEKGQAIYLKSKLYQNEVKLIDPEIQAEFRQLIRCGYSSHTDTPLTKFLHEQKMLSSEDEIAQSISEIQRLMKKSLLLTIMPTEGCNFRCPYCYEDHIVASMTRKTIDRIKEYITQQAGNFEHINVAWFGGEPTLCRDTVLEISELLQTLKKTNAFQYTASMTTNGYLLGEEFFKQYYDAGITTFQITIDGWNHNKTRPHVSGKETLTQILTNLKAISSLPEEKFQYQMLIRHNVLAGDEDFSWYDYLFNLFGNDKRFSLLIRPVGDWGGNSVKSLHILSPEDADVLVSKHVKYLRQIGFPCNNGAPGILSQVCYASYPYGLVFRPDGKIVKCTVCLNHPKNLVGYVDPEKGVILDEEANLLWSAPQPLKSECKKCPDVLSCMNMACRKAQLVDELTAPVCFDKSPQFT